MWHYGVHFYNHISCWMSWIYTNVMLPTWRGVQLESSLKIVRYSRQKALGFRVKSPIWGPTYLGMQGLLLRYSEMKILTHLTKGVEAFGSVGSHSFATLGWIWACASEDWNLGVRARQLRGRAHCGRANLCIRIYTWVSNNGLSSTASLQQSLLNSQFSFHSIWQSLPKSYSLMYSKLSWLRIALLTLYCTCSSLDPYVLELDCEPSTHNCHAWQGHHQLDMVLGFRIFACQLIYSLLRRAWTRAFVSVPSRPYVSRRGNLINDRLNLSTYPHCVK